MIGVSKMNFELTNEQVKERKEVIRFIESVLVQSEHIEDETFLKKSIEQCKQFGLWEKILGKQTDWVTKITLLIELAKAVPSFSALFIDLLMSRSFVSNEVNTEFLSTAFVEKQAGSDLSLIQTTAEKKNRALVVNGEKWFVFNYQLADAFLVLAKTDQHSFVIVHVPRESKGIEIVEQKKMGLKEVKLGKIFFDNVEVSLSAATSINELRDLSKSFDVAKLAVSSLAIGISEKALKASLERVQSRQQFGKSIGDFQAIQFKIAEMTVQINAAKSLLYDAAQKLDRGEDIQAEAAMAKTFSSESARRIVNHAVQIYGAHGILDDSIPANLYQDQRLTEIFAQTSEIQRTLIADYVVKNIHKKVVDYGF